MICKFENILINRTIEENDGKLSCKIFTYIIRIKLNKSINATKYLFKGDLVLTNKETDALQLTAHFPSKFS